MPNFNEVLKAHMKDKKWTMDIGSNPFGDVHLTPQEMVEDGLLEAPSPKEQGIRLISVGADVEEFLVDVEGKPVPCIGVMGGTKDNPRPLGIGDGYAVQEDNVMMEYNIPPAKDKYAFVYAICRAQEELGRALVPHKLSRLVVPSMIFLPEQLAHPQAQVFGCEPDYNVWERRVNEFKKAGNPNLRTAGGHIHVGFNVDGKAPDPAENLLEMEQVVMAMDLYFGLPSVLLDLDQRRREMYGKAGAFRMKNYGIEYRVGSNFWTRSSGMVGWAYECVETAIRTIQHAPDVLKLAIQHKDKIQEAINTGNRDIAMSYMSHFGIRRPNFPALEAA